MRLTYTQIKDKPQKLLALTGLTRSEFDDLLEAFSKVSPRGRLRQSGKSSRATLCSNEDQLLFILVYLNTYPLLEITGELFGMEVPTVSKWTQPLLPIVCNALDEFGAMPERKAEATRSKQRTERITPANSTTRRHESTTAFKKKMAHYHGTKKAHQVWSETVSCVPDGILNAKSS